MKGARLLSRAFAHAICLQVREGSTENEDDSREGNFLKRATRRAAAERENKNESAARF